MGLRRYYIWFFNFIICGFILLPSPAYAQMTNLCNGCSTPINAHGICYNVYNATGASIMIPWNSYAEWVSFINGRPGGVSLSSCVTPLSLIYAGSSPSCYGEGCVYTINFHIAGGSGNYRIYTENYGGAYITTPYVGSGPINAWPYGYNTISQSGNVITTTHYSHATGGTIQAWAYDNVTGSVATTSGAF